MKAAWYRLTLMRFVQPGDDWEITPLRIAGTVALAAAFCGVWMLAMTLVKG